MTVTLPAGQFCAAFHPTQRLSHALSRAGCAVLCCGAGQYVIVPMTFQPGCLGEYWLSVFVQRSAFRLAGGVEVQWDEPSEEEVTTAGDDIPTVERSSTTPSDLHEGADDSQERALNALHALVASMVESVEGEGY